MNNVQAKRLLNVAKALRAAHAAKKKFNMDKFVFGDESDIVVEYIGGDFGGPVNACNMEEEFCGTPACALGHYAARTDLQRLLKIGFDKDEHGVKFARLCWFGEAPSNMSPLDYDDERFQNHFGLDYQEMDELFNFHGCGGAKTPLQAAKYIERFVKRKLARG